MDSKSAFNVAKAGQTAVPTFYDVKLKKKVKAEVTDKAKYGKPGNERYAFRAKTPDGRNLTRFVSKADWDKAKV